MKHRLVRLMEGTLVKAFVFSLVLAVAFSAKVNADVIPYPDAGTPNTVVYTFTAVNTGDITAYFAGANASDNDKLGLLVNGVSTGVFGLDNQTSSVGQSLDLGSAHAGDTLTFVVENLTKGKSVYSNPALNDSYDTNGSDGHDHVYSVPYTATNPVFAGIPVGTYVAFEDQAYPNSDFDYNDLQFVFTNVAIAPVPEPVGVTSLVSLGAIGLIGYGWRRKRAAA